MKVWLMSKEKISKPLWLPTRADGHHSFSDQALPVRVPISIEADVDRWVCRAEGGAVLQIRDAYGMVQDVQEVPIQDRSLLAVRFQGRKYRIYAEEDNASADTYSLYALDAKTEYLIGSGDECHIVYKNPWVESIHASLHWVEGNWFITDKGKPDRTAGIYLNTKKITKSALESGDKIFIMGLSILAVDGFLAFNDASGRVALRSASIRKIKDFPEMEIKSCTQAHMLRNLFERQPRKRTRIHKDAIAIEMPPMPVSGNKIPLLLRLGSPMLMGGRALATGNVLTAMTSLVFPAMTQGLTEKERKEYEEKRQSGYRNYLRKVEEEIRQEVSREQNRLNQTYPDLTEVMRYALSKTRLWERRKNDDDFLRIRIGAGQSPLLAKREYPERHFELEPDVLTEEMYQVAEHPYKLKNVPVMLDFTQDPVVGIPGPARGLAA